MKIAELKLLKNVSESMVIENAIQGSTDWDKDGRKIFSPYTWSSTCSTWKVGFKVRHRGADIWLWFSAYMFTTGEIEWMFTSSYSTKTGKRLRTDAEWNLRYSLGCKAELLSYDVSDVTTKAGLKGNRLCLYNGADWRIEPGGDDGFCHLWIGFNYITCCKSRLEAKVFIKYKSAFDRGYLIWQMHEDWVNFNMNMKKEDEVTQDAFREMHLGFKYRGMIVGKNDRGDLVFTRPTLDDNPNVKIRM